MASSSPPTNDQYKNSTFAAAGGSGTPTQSMGSSTTMFFKPIGQNINIAWKWTSLKDKNSMKSENTKDIRLELKAAFDAKKEKMKCIWRECKRMKMRKTRCTIFVRLKSGERHTLSIEVSLAVAKMKNVNVNNPLNCTSSKNLKKLSNLDKTRNKQACTMLVRTKQEQGQFNTVL
ncbi:hypothetical protein CR513_08346, partial [Mucuna pruriens]